MFFFDLNCILLAASLINGVVCILDKTKQSHFVGFNCCILLAARLVIGVVCTENNFSRKSKKRKNKNSPFFSSKARKSKARNIYPYKFASANKPWITPTSLPFCLRSQKLSKEVPLPLFVLSSHQIEEESIFGGSSYHSI